MVDLQQLLITELNKLKESIRQRLDETGTNASGRAYNSLKVSVKGNEGTLYGSSYLKFLEDGRGPGPVPKDFRSIIEDWVLAKGIDFSSYTPKGRSPSSLSDEDRLHSFAGAVAFNIMKKGTLLYRKKVHKDIYSAAITECLDRLESLVTVNISANIQNINQRYKDETDRK